MKTRRAVLVVMVTSMALLGRRASAAPPSGPANPPPGGVSILDSGSDGTGQQALMGGRTFTYSALNSTTYSHFFGAQPALVRAAFNGSLAVLTYSAADSSFPAGKVVWTGSTSWTRLTSCGNCSTSFTFSCGASSSTSTVFLRATLNITDTGGSPLALVDATTLGLPSSVGGVRALGAATSLKAKILFEASFSSGSGFSPAIEFWNANDGAGGHTCSGISGSNFGELVDTSFTGGFWTYTRPTAAASGSAAICSGGSTPLSGSGSGTTGPYFCSWSPATGLSNAASCTPTASPASTTVYSLTVTDANGVVSTNTSTATVTVNPLPTASASGSAAICNGGSTALSGSGSGTTGPYSCSWAPATGLDNAASCTPNASPTSTTIYTLTVTDANLCSSTNAPQVTVTVNPLPTAIASGSTQLCPGFGPTGITGTGDTVGPYSCVWTPATGLTDATSCTPGANPASNTTYSLTVTDGNGCISTNLATVTIDIYGSIAATGATSLCRDNLGGTASVNPVAPGGPNLFQWGYRTVSGTGTITDIAGKTGSVYDIQGVDFPVPGSYPATYYLVCRQVAPACLGNLISNEIPITLTGASCGTAVSDPVQFFNVTTRNSGGMNILQWVNPASGAPDLRINSRTDDTFPTDPADGTSVVTGAATPAGAKVSYNDTTVANGTTYSYGAFTCASGCGASDFSGAKEVAAYTFNSPAKTKWVYSTAGIATTAPGMKTGTGAAVMAVSNDRNLHAMAAGASGGTWPATWMPYAMNAPSQSRPIPITLTTTMIGGTKTVVVVGAQDGRVYAFNSTTGALLWASAVLGDNIQASPSAMFTDFGGLGNLVFAGTRNSSSDNKLYALNALTGAVVWTFDNGGGAAGIGIITGQPAVDYANKRVYFTSRAKAGGSSDTVWCLKLNTATTFSKLWSVAAGNIDGSIINSAGTLYVGTVSGDVTALVPATGASKWLSSFATGDGAVKTLIWPDSGRLYFSTTTKVWAITDNGASTTPTAYWTSPIASIPNPSNPIVLSGRAYVGGSNGVLYQITANVVSPPAPLFVTLGAPGKPFQVGQPTNDTANGLLLVGTESGQIYAVARPF